MVVMGANDSHQNIALAIIIVFPVLSTIILALRLYTRKLLTRNIGWDDWLVVVAWVCCLHHP